MHEQLIARLDQAHERRHHLDIALAARETVVTPSSEHVTQ
jgi:hypothetical protein